VNYRSTVKPMMTRDKSHGRSFRYGRSIYRTCLNYRSQNSSSDIDLRCFGSSRWMSDENRPGAGLGFKVASPDRYGMLASIFPLKGTTMDALANSERT
jgi:hypothetical protein